MVNVVTVGRFKGKKIKAGVETVFILIERERLDITYEIVDHIRLMDVVQEKSIFSGLLRGYFAKWLGNTAWLSAIQSAHSKCKYRIRISYRDGTASVCIVDSQILDRLAVTCDYLQLRIDVGCISIHPNDDFSENRCHFLRLT